MIYLAIPFDNSEALKKRKKIFLVLPPTLFTTSRDYYSCDGISLEWIHKLFIHHHGELTSSFNFHETWEKKLSAVPSQRKRMKFHFFPFFRCNSLLIHFRVFGLSCFVYRSAILMKVFSYLVTRNHRTLRHHTTTKTSSSNGKKSCWNSWSWIWSKALVRMTIRWNPWRSSSKEIPTRQQKANKKSRGDCLSDKSHFYLFSYMRTPTNNDAKGIKKKKWFPSTSKSPARFHFHLHLAKLNKKHLKVSFRFNTSASRVCTPFRWRLMGVGKQGTIISPVYHHKSRTQQANEWKWRQVRCAPFKWLTNSHDTHSSFVHCDLIAGANNYWTFFFKCPIHCDFVYSKHSLTSINLDFLDVPKFC